MSDANPTPHLTSAASRNAVMGLTARVSTLLVGLLLTPFVLHSLRAELYGVIVVIGSFYDYLSLLRGGVGNALRRYVPLSHHGGDTDLAKQYYAAGFWLTAILRTTVLLGGLALAWPMTAFLHLDAVVRPEAAIGIALQVTAAILTDLALVMNVPIYVTGRTDKISRIELQQGWVRLGIVLIAFSAFGGSLPVYGAALVLISLVQVFTTGIVAQQTSPVGPVIPRPSMGGPTVRTNLFRYGGLAIVSQLAGLLYIATDNLLIGRIYGPTFVTHFTLGARWTPIVLGLIFSIGAGLMPFFTMLEARGASEKSRSTLLRATAVVTAISVPLCFTPCIVGDLFLRHWVGTDYEGSYAYLLAMLGPAVMEGALSPIFIALGGRGRIGWLATADLAVALANVVLSLVLALGFGLGLLGFAIGSGASLFAKNIILAAVARRKDEAFPPVGASLRPFPRAVLGAVPGLALLWLLRPVYEGTLPTVLLAGVLGGALALAGSVFLTLGTEEIGRLWSAIPGTGALPWFPRRRRADVRTSGVRARVGIREDEIPSPSVAGTTVCLPVYNGANVVERALRSVEAQTRAPLEILAIDDGSTDETPRVLETLQRAGRLRFIRQDNRGVGGARNTAIRHARGEWILPLDADDALDPHAIERAEAAVRRVPEAGWCFSDITRIDGRKEEVFRTVLPAGPPSGWLRAMLEHNFAERTILLRRTMLFQIGGYDESCNCFEDWELNLRMLRAGVVGVYAPGALYRYVKTEGSITSNPRRLLSGYEGIFTRHHRPLADRGGADLRHLYARRLRGLGSEYFNLTHDLPAALLCVARSLAYDFDLRWLARAIRARMLGGGR